MVTQTLREKSFALKLRAKRSFKIFLAERLLFSLPGMNFTLAVKVIAKNWRHIDLFYFPRVLFILFLGVMNSLLSLLEWIKLGMKKSGGKVSVSGEQDPIFILGYWRSGTTYAHRLLALDKRFYTPSQYQASLPHTYLILDRIKCWVNAKLPENRIYDNVKLDLDEPWEDETALFSLTGLSPMMSSCFPRQASQYEKYLSFDGVSEREVRRWGDALAGFLRKLTILNLGERLLLKSPPHTSRISLLRSMYPNSKFIFLYRDPYKVYLSSLNMMKIFGAQVQLQVPREGDIERNVLNMYQKMHDKYFSDVSLVDSDCIVELCFEDLRNDPIFALEKVYKKLNLGHWEEYKRQLKSHLGSREPYVQNHYIPLEYDEMKYVYQRWKRCFDRWGYESRI